jgi:uncharacterized protein
MTKIIIDTNVYFSGYAFKGIPLEVINLACSEKIVVYCSFRIWDEIVNKFMVGRMKEIQKDFYDIEKVQSFLDNLEKSITFKVPTKKVDVCRDVKDNMILELASEVNADYIITGDKDLLVLNHFENSKILKPSQFLEIFN